MLSHSWTNYLSSQIRPQKTKVWPTNVWPKSYQNTQNTYKQSTTKSYVKDLEQECSRSKKFQNMLSQNNENILKYGEKMFKNVLKCWKKAEKKLKKSWKKVEKSWKKVEKSSRMCCPKIMTWKNHILSQIRPQKTKVWPPTTINLC